MDGDIAAGDAEVCRLQSLVAAVDGDGGAVGAGGAYGEVVVAVDGVIPGVNGQVTAENGQGGLGVDGVVDGALMVRVRSRITSHASPSSSVVAPDLMPFLPLAFTVRLPLPHRVT